MGPSGMLLGEHDHTLDDKNRLTLPAKLREELGDEVVITRGLDGCLSVYSKAAFDCPRRAGRHARPVPAGDAHDAALLLHRRAAGRARQAGTDGDPGQAPRECGHRARGDGRRRLRPPRDLGSRHRGASSSRKPKGARKMLPSVLPTETDHVPVLADEVLDRARAAAGRDGRRLHVRRRRALGAARRPPARRGQADRDRPRPDGRAVLRAPAADDRRQGAPAARRVLAGARAARLERRARRRDPARPRRLLDAARPARARLLLRRRRAARHAHGSVGRPDRGRRRQRDERMGARRHLPPLRRGALRAPDRARDRAAPLEAAVRAHRRPRRDDQAGDARRRRASARGIRRSASSRRSGSRSTTSSARSSARCRPRSRCCARTGGSR